MRTTVLSAMLAGVLVSAAVSDKMMPVEQKCNAIGGNACLEENSSVDSANHQVKGVAWLVQSDGHDQSIEGYEKHTAVQLKGLDLSSTLAKVESMFASSMDPTSPENKASLQKVMEEPVSKLMDRAVEAISNISLDDPSKAKQQLQLVQDMTKAARDISEQALESWHAAISKQGALFEDTVDIRNKKIKETTEQALLLFTTGIDAQLAARKLVFEQRSHEHTVMLAAAKSESDAMATIAEKQLATDKARDEHQLDYDSKKADAEHKVMLKELERQEKKNQVEHDKAVKETERTHARMAKELERLEKRGKIDADARAKVMQEFQVEMERYNQEWDLAKIAMSDAIKNGGSCQLRHTAPKIDWGNPPDKPAQVVPGSVSWEYRKGGWR